MIKISNKQDCCGCSACIEICPKQCISLQEDKEGFLYPKIIELNCIDCHLCEKVCPVICQAQPREPLNVYAAKNMNEDIRILSSSGGVFTALAENIIEENGVVFGAKFNEQWEVVHGYTETKKDLALFRGSKYVQSRIESTYKEAEFFLKQNRKVLFSGTPCQIAGLKLFLRNEYDNLITVDFICHGVPSPKVWRMYLSETIERQCVKNTVLPHSIYKRNTIVKNISFRNKCLGWKKFSFALSLSTIDKSGNRNTVLFSEVFYNNLFMKGFLLNLYLRPSCYSCPVKSLKSGSDITIGDFWGIDKEYMNQDDDKGHNAVLLNTLKGTTLFQKTNVSYFEVPYTIILKHNQIIERSCLLPDKRTLFFKQINDSSISELLAKMLYKSFWKRTRNRVSRLKKRILRYLKRI